MGEGGIYRAHHNMVISTKEEHGVIFKMVLAVVRDYAKKLTDSVWCFVPSVGLSVVLRGVWGDGKLPEPFAS